MPDIVPASDLLADYRNCNVAADRGYDSIDLEEQLKAQGCTVVIPSRKTNKVQRDLDWHLYKERHLVEVFSRLSHDRVDLRPGPGETTPTNPVLEGLRNGAPRAFAGTSKNSA